MEAQLLSGVQVGYLSGNISVDNNFARFGEKSFAINKINSVEVRKRVHEGSKAYIFMIIAAIFCILAIFGSSNIVIPIVLLLVFGVIGYFSWIGRHNKFSYHLYLVTSSSEAQAYSTSDANEIGRLRKAIEDAMSVSA